jgi:hypothetical protein
VTWKEITRITTYVGDDGGEYILLRRELAGLDGLGDFPYSDLVNKTQYCCGSRLFSPESFTPSAICLITFSRFAKTVVGMAYPSRTLVRISE